MATMASMGGGGTEEEVAEKQTSSVWEVHFFSLKSRPRRHPKENYLCQEQSWKRQMEEFGSGRGRRTPLLLGGLLILLLIAGAVALAQTFSQRWTVENRIQMNFYFVKICVLQRHGFGARMCDGGGVSPLAQILCYHLPRSYVWNFA